MGRFTKRLITVAEQRLHLTPSGVGMVRAEPTSAVLDELRKIASRRAQSAKKRGDWVEIIRYLEGYNELANKWRKYCIEMVNQEPPPHAEKDQRLLEEAKVKLKACQHSVVCPEKSSSACW